MLRHIMEFVTPKIIEYMSEDDVCAVVVVVVDAQAGAVCAASHPKYSLTRRPSTARLRDAASATLCRSLETASCRSSCLFWARVSTPATTSRRGWDRRSDSRRLCGASLGHSLRTTSRCSRLRSSAPSRTRMPTYVSHTLTLLFHSFCFLQLHTKPAQQHHRCVRRRVWPSTSCSRTSVARPLRT